MIKKFLSDSFLYVIASLFTKGLSFLMLPIYIGYLSITEYGVFDYILTIGTFLGICISLEIAQSVMRFAPESINDLDRHSRYISNGLWFTLFSYLILIIFSSFFLDSLSVYLTGEDYNQQVVFVALVTFMSTALMYYVSVIYRSRLNAKAATMSSAASGFFVAILSLIFIYVFDLGLISLLLAMIIGQCSVVLINIIKLREIIVFKIDYKLLYKMLRFSAPLILSSLGVILSTMVDRIMIKEMLTFDEVAIYGVAARFAALVALLIVGFQSALTPLVYSNLKDKNLKSNLLKLLKGYVLIGSGLVFFLIVFSDLLINVVVGADYKESASLIPIIASAVLLHSAYIFFPGLSIVKKTSVLAVINILAGLSNIALNYLFLPKYGVVGAAYATLISAGLYFSLNAYFSEKNYPLLKFKTI